MTDTAVRSILTFSTGSVRIHPQHAARGRLPVPVWLFLSRAWGSPRPVHCFLIEHEEGLVLFDAGQDPASVSDPDYYPSGRFTGAIYDRLARFEIEPQDGVSSQIRAAGYSPDDVRTVVISHLHQDHIGGLRELPRARFVVAEAEWRELMAPRPEARGYLTRHIDIPGLEWQRVTFSRSSEPDFAPFTSRHDLFSDGSLVLLPTPGHTEGSLSMLVRWSGPPLLLVGDLSYDATLMSRGIVPGIGVRRTLEDSTRKVLELAQRLDGTVVLPAHDPGTSERLSTAGGHVLTR